MEPKYEPRIVAFVDVLGFSAIIKRMGNDPILHNQVHAALTHIGTYKDPIVLGAKNPELEVSVFSDSIVMSGDQNSFGYLIWNCGWLQAQLLGLGILTRGGMSIGRLVHSKDVLYGEGMLNAHQIESSASVYPRIVVDPALMSKATDKIRKVFLEQDGDDLWFVDPYAFGALAGNLDVLVEDGYDPHEVYLDEVSEHIKQGIHSAKQVDHLAKWSWLKRRHEAAHKRYLKTRETKLSKLSKETENR